MVFLNHEASYATFFATLLIFTAVILLLSYRSLFKDIANPNEAFLSARSSYRWAPLGASLFASLMGNWVINLPAFVGAVYGWPGIISYALASSLPYCALIWFAPRVRSFTEYGFCSSDFLIYRFGRWPQVICSLVSLCMMFVILSTELTTAGMTMSALTGGTFPLHYSIGGVALIPLFYTLIGGLRCSIISDTIQSIVIIGLMIPFSVYLIATAPSARQFSVSNYQPFGRSVLAGTVLILSSWPGFLTDQGIWQRVWAAKSDRDVRLSMLLCAVLSGFSVFIFGSVGAVCLSHLDVHTSGTTLIEYSTSVLPLPWLVVVCILATTCVISSVDTYQSALASLLGHDLLRNQLPFNWARLAMVLINVPAIVVALLQVPLMDLFMVSNLLCATVAGPIVFSVYPRTTLLGFFGGFIVSLTSCLICGLVDSRLRERGVLDVSFFIPKDISRPAYVVTFIIVPAMGSLATYFVSLIDNKYRLAEKMFGGNFGKPLDSIHIITQSEFNDSVWAVQDESDGSKKIHC